MPLVWDDPTLTWDADILWDGGSFQGGTTATLLEDTAAVRIQQRQRIAAVHWHIDGHPVKLNDDFEASITASGGYEQLTASCERFAIRKAHQGSHVHAIAGGREVWSGTLDATPATSRDPLAKITATGPVARARRKRGNFLEQSRNYSAWAEMGGDPYDYTSPGSLKVASTIGLKVNPGALRFDITKGTDIKQNHAMGAAAWFPDEPITRIAFTTDADAANGNFKLRILTGAGPSGSLAQTLPDIAFDDGTHDISVNGGDDLIVLAVVRTGPDDASTAGHNWLRVTNLRVNGRTSKDDLSPGEIIADMAGAIGWNTDHVRSSGQNGLPFYWEGGSWADAIDELATLDDWPWRVDSHGIVYGPWETNWRLNFSQENEDLDFPPIYNSVRVFYTTLAGSARSVRVEADPDPLKRFDVDNEYQYDLAQSYASDTIPTQVGEALIDRLSEQRVVGSVTVTRADRDQRVRTPHLRHAITSFEEMYHLLPGQLARLEPYPNLPAQRIVEVRLHSNDVQVVFGEDIESVSAGRVLARASLTASRRHGRRKHHKHHR